MKDVPKISELREACIAIKHGVVWRGIAPDGITKDEALEYAGVLADYVDELLNEWGYD